MGDHVPVPHVDGHIVAGTVLAAQPHGANGAFPLTVDSIMRGPDLVGYPPESLRWSGDSQRLYFEWRHPGILKLFESNLK